MTINCSLLCENDTQVNPYKIEPIIIYALKEYCVLNGNFPTPLYWTHKQMATRDFEYVLECFLNVLLQQADCATEVFQSPIWCKNWSGVNYVLRRTAFHTDFSTLSRMDTLHQILFTLQDNGSRILSNVATCSLKCTASYTRRIRIGILLLTYLLTYLLHGAESFLSSWLACS